MNHIYSKWLLDQIRPKRSSVSTGIFEQAHSLILLSKKQPLFYRKIHKIFKNLQNLRKLIL